MRWAWDAEVAVISYACAAAMWDLRGVPSGPVEVTTLVGARSTTGIRVHESTLPPAVTYHDGLPVTSVARTLVDLAAVVSPDQRVLGHTVDFYWPAQRLVVEIDGAQAHLTRSAFENDRRRDAHLIAHGITVARYTFLRLTREPDAIAAELGAQFCGTAQMSSALAAHAP